MRLGNHDKNRLALVVVILTVALCPPCNDAQASSMPLSIATAGADLSLATGLDAVSGNPAQLGLPQHQTTQFRLLGFGGGIGNNSFGLSDYRRYNGATLTAEDKADILDNIPDDGLALRAEAGVSALSLRLGHWAVTSSAIGSASGRIDQDAVELLLYGNAHQTDWNFDQSDASGFAAWQIAVSHGRRLGSFVGSPLYVGATLSHIRGLYFAEASQIEAGFATATNGLVGDATADWLTASGGSGWGLDLGVAWQPSAASLVSFKLENLIHTISWNRDVEITHFSLVFDDLTLDNFDDSLWVSEEVTEPHANLSRGLPLRLRLGAMRSFKRFQLALDASVSVAERFASSTKPVLAGAVSYALWRPVTLRTGLAAGGASGFAVGWGLGLNLGPVVLDTAVRIDRGMWIGNGRGLTAAMALDLAF
jgi:hypothetical protein